MKHFVRFTRALALAPALLTPGAMAGCTRSAHATTTECPPAEPPNGTSCTTAPGNVCTFAAPAVRPQFCYCYADRWVCGVPLGIDMATAVGCPATQPTTGSACTALQSTTPVAPGNRVGCRYELRSSITRDCVCAHSATSNRAVWDCGQRTGSAPVDARGCPARQPVADSLCTVNATQCQYGYNLSTTCACTALQGNNERRAWRCTTSPQPHGHPPLGPLPPPELLA